MLKKILFFPVLLIAITACTNNYYSNNVVVTKTIEAVGYSNTSNFEKYPQAQRQLLAIRGAKLDAYRNLAEELYGVRIRSNTTVKDMVVKNDSYRAYIDAVVRGAHVETITPRDNGVYEVEVNLTLTRDFYDCLMYERGCPVQLLDFKDNE